MRRVEKSLQMKERAKQCLAGGVNSSMRLTADPLLFFQRAEGSHIFDEDGNEYIDYKLGAGPLILGHSPRSVIQAVEQQLALGLQTATETSLSVEVAARLVELIPCAELVRLTNSGSESVQLALRLARAYRGRNKIIRFEGHYHGWFDNICTKTPLDSSADVAESEGQGSALNELIVLPWNDLDVFAQTVQSHREEIGGVIMTPIMFGTAAGAMPREGYLEGIRRICTDNEIVLIFDEVLTGFRVAQGGAQELFGVLPDLATYAKAISGGLPMAALAGCREVMGMIGSGRVSHYGTYNANALCCAAAKATLQELTRDHGQFYRHCNDLRQQITDGICESAARHNIPLHVSGAGAIMNFWFTDTACVYDYRSSRAGHNSAQQKKFSRSLLERGVLSDPLQMFFSSAHTQQDIDMTLQAIEETMGTLKKGEPLRVEP